MPGTPCCGRWRRCPCRRAPLAEAVGAGLAARAQALGLGLPQLARQLRLTPDLLFKLDRGYLRLDTVPRRFLAHIAAVLHTTAEGLLAGLPGGPAPAAAVGYLHADQPQEAQQQTFLEALAHARGLPAAERERWTAAAREEGLAGERRADVAPVTDRWAAVRRRAAEARRVATVLAEPRAHGRGLVEAALEARGYFVMACPRTTPSCGAAWPRWRPTASPTATGSARPGPPSPPPTSWGTSCSATARCGTAPRRTSTRRRTPSGCPTATAPSPPTTPGSSGELEANVFAVAFLLPPDGLRAGFLAGELVPAPGGALRRLPGRLPERPGHLAPRPAAVRCRRASLPGDTDGACAVRGPRAGRRPGPARPLAAGGRRGGGGAGAGQRRAGDGQDPHPGGARAAPPGAGRPGAPDPGRHLLQPGDRRDARAPAAGRARAGPRADRLHLPRLLPGAAAAPPRRRPGCRRTCG